MSGNRKRWNKVNTGPNTGSFVNEANENNATRKRRQNKYKSLLEGVEERRSFVPSYNKKINDTGDNHPKEALLILGHGNEGWKTRVPIEESDDEETIKRKKKDRIPDLIKVPKGSIVVIKSHPGDVTLSTAVNPQYIRVLQKENEAVILDPIKNIDKITELFGSVSIFREGDMCPNIFHYPVAMWGQDKPDESNITLRQSGIASIPLKTPIEDSELYNLIDRKIFIPKFSFSKNNKGNTLKNDLLLTEEDKTKILENFKFMDPTIPSRDGKSTIIKSLEGIIDENINKTTISDFFKNEFGFYRKQLDLFNIKPKCVTYALNCRFINDHADYVPEEVRLGYKTHNNLKGVVNYHVSNSTKQTRYETNTSTNLIQNRSNTPQNPTHLQEYLHAIHKPALQKYNIVKNPDYKYNKLLDPEGKGKFHAYINPDATNSIVVSPLPRRNNNLNKTRNRKRVSSMAPEIQQEIKEAINQRRPSTLSRARATRKNTRNQNFEDYQNLFRERLNKPTYKQSLVNKLENLHPGIEEQFFNKILDDNEEYEKSNNWYRNYYKYTMKYTNISKNPKILEYKRKKEEIQKKEEEIRKKEEYESNKENIIMGMRSELRYLLNSDPEVPALKREIFETIKGYFKESDFPDYYYGNTRLFLEVNPEFTDEVKEIIKSKMADPNFKNDSEYFQQLKAHLGL